MAIASSNPQVLYAEVQAVDPQGGCGVLQLLGETTARGCFLGLWRTANGGTTWTQVANHTTMSFPEGTVTAGPCGEDTPQMWYDMGLAVHLAARRYGDADGGVLGGWQLRMVEC